MTKPALPMIDGVRQITAVRLPQTLLQRLESFIAAQPFNPSRTRVIEEALRRFLDEQEQPKPSAVPDRNGKA